MARAFHARSAKCVPRGRYDAGRERGPTGFSRVFIGAAHTRTHAPFPSRRTFRARASKSNASANRHTPGASLVPSYVPYVVDLAANSVSLSSHLSPSALLSLRVFLSLPLAAVQSSRVFSFSLLISDFYLSLSLYIYTYKPLCLSRSDVRCPFRSAGFDLSSYLFLVFIAIPSILSSRSIPASAARSTFPPISLCRAWHRYPPSLSGVFITFALSSSVRPPPLPLPLRRAGLSPYCPRYLPPLWYTLLTFRLPAGHPQSPLLFSLAARFLFGHDGEPSSLSPPVPSYVDLFPRFFSVFFFSSRF